MSLVTIADETDVDAEDAVISTALVRVACAVDDADDEEARKVGKCPETLDVADDAPISPIFRLMVDVAVERPLLEPASPVSLTRFELVVDTASEVPVMNTSDNDRTALLDEVADDADIRPTSREIETAVVEIASDAAASPMSPERTDATLDVAEGLDERKTWASVILAAAVDVALDKPPSATASVIFDVADEAPALDPDREPVAASASGPSP